ncbi:MAG: F0F1 ATP synthase subunit delta [bacterium]|nr:F0F1 ATP synthase subunit delta [bacterium]
MEPKPKRDIAPKLGRIYAKAALEIAQEMSAVTVWEEKLELLAEIVKMPDFEKILRDPRLKPEDMKDVMKPVYDKMEVDEIFRDFVNALIEGKKLSYAPWVFESYVRQRKELEGNVDITLTSAFPMDVATADHLIGRIKDKFNIVAGETKVAVDPSLIGGMVIKIGDYEIDQSTRGYIERKKRLGL